MKFKNLIAGLLLSTSTFAGNGSSGGGHIHGDSINPWFFQNTKSVRFCVDMSDDFANITKERASNLIQKAFSMWKTELNQQHVLDTFDFEETPLTPRPQIGTQIFIEEQCKNSTDLKFQLGKLNEDQQKKLGKLNQVIGTAYRESYDEVNLRGKGFIYIAPENGKDRPISAKFGKEPWSYGKNTALLYTIYHEIGHIFGLKDAVNAGVPVMSTHFVYIITKEEVYKHLDQFLQYFGKSWTQLGYSGKTTNQFFEDSNCEELTKEVLTFIDYECQFDDELLNLKGNGEYIELLNNEEPAKRIGKFYLSHGDETISAGDHALIAIWLTEKQKVFDIETDDQDEYNSLMNFPTALYTFKSTSPRIINTLYVSDKGTERKVNINFDGLENVNIEAVINGEFQSNIFKDEVKSKLKLFK